MDLSKWRGIPKLLMAVGGLGIIAGLVVNKDDLGRFGYSWLVAFMFFLSLGIGGLGLTILHHLFDAAWSVPVRRVYEQLGGMLRYLAILWIPIGLLAPKMYEWLRKVVAGKPDESTLAKYPLFTIGGFYAVSIVCLGVLVLLSKRFKDLSTEQDKTGAAALTKKMQRLACGGVFLFALALTFGAIMWMKALEHEWFSTMYGVYYFAGSMWLSLSTVYVVIRVLDIQGPLKGYVHEKTYYYIGTLLFAFTVFYSYVTFSQYFIIWNANVPEETFWYLQREKGGWWYAGLALIFGHFFVPFLSLLRIDAKLNLRLMGFIAVWAWIMHFIDMSFNILPVRDPAGWTFNFVDISCWMFMCGLLITLFVKALKSAPILPQKDPRFAESQDILVAAPTAGAEGTH